MNVTKDGIKDRQLHIEDYLQMVSAEQKEYAEVSAHQRIAENNDIITDFQTDRLMEKILSNDNLNQAYKKVKLILSRLVDTFSSRILYPMLLLSGNHSIAVV